MINMKIINVVGTRPNFMKIAPILRQMRKYAATFQPILIHTGQHYDYLDAHENLRREGIPKERIFFVGNVMVDTLLYSKEKARKSDILARLGLTTNKGVLRAADYALLTLHRPNNVDNKKNLKRILDALSEIQKKIKIVFPIHPRTRRRLREFGLQSFLSNSGQWNPTIQSINWETNSVIITPPLAYLDFLKLEMKARFIMTDSGGIQEEATVLGVPCLTLRETTERPVTITQGTNVMVGNDRNRIIKEALKILGGNRKRGKRPQFWDGRSAERIVRILREQSK